MRRRLLALTVVSVMLFGSAACGDDTGKASGSSSPSVDMGTAIPGVTVSGQVGSTPDVKVKAPLKLKKPETQVVHAGSGAPVKEGQSALLHITIANGRTGQKAVSTYDQNNPEQYTIAQGQFFPDAINALVNKPVGSRVAVAGPVQSFFGTAGAPQFNLKASDTMVMVLDVMSVQPQHVASGPSGTKQKVPAGLPSVVEQGTKVTNLDFSKAAKKPSNKLQVIPLVKGHGPKTRAGSLVTFNYFGEVYGAKKPFDESYSKSPATFALGTGGLIPAWDKGLVGLPAGRRVMIVAPPNKAYGPPGPPQGGIPKNATLVFVVDILGVDG
ncbi:MAG: FKBP-type peptidyl-prolyl cis-trans isomerase [Nocardioidaceae bacterium]